MLSYCSVRVDVGLNAGVVLATFKFVVHRWTLTQRVTCRSGTTALIVRASKTLC